MTMTARLSVNSHKNGMLDNAGNKALMTCGMVSPTMMQKAIMPPKALTIHLSELQRGKKGICSQSPLGDLSEKLSDCCMRVGSLRTEIAMSPDLPKQYSAVAWKEFAPLSLELTTINRMVQSTWLETLACGWLEPRIVKGHGQLVP